MVIFLWLRFGRFDKLAYDCWELSTEEFRDVIEGRVHFRKCPSCAGHGYEYYNSSTGELVDRLDDSLLQKLQAEFELSTDCCDICRGLGYIQSYSD